MRTDARRGHLERGVEGELAAFPLPPMDDAIAAPAILAGDGVVFDASDLMVPEIGTGTFWTGVVGYLRGDPLGQVLAQIEISRPANAG